MSKYNRNTVIICILAIVVSLCSLYFKILAVRAMP